MTGKPRLTVLLVSALLVCSSLQADKRKFEVLAGFQAVGPFPEQRRVDYGEDIYYIEPTGIPLDRERIASAPILYVDRFPEGQELFRGDLEAIVSMVEKGGVLVLIGGAEASTETLGNLNYVGRRLGFRLTNDVVVGQIQPYVVRRGPMRGDVWLCSKGVRVMNLVGEGWAWHYFIDDESRPVMASRRIGRGIVVVLGTSEINRYSEGAEHNAVTLLDWAMRVRDRSSSDPGVRDASFIRPAASGPAGDAEAGTEQESGRVLSPIEAAKLRREQGVSGGTDSPGGLLTEEDAAEVFRERLEKMRRSLGVTEQRSGESVLVPVNDRLFLKGHMKFTDIDGNVVDLAALRGRAVLVVFWATWDRTSMSVMPKIVELDKELRPRGLTVVGMSLDKSIEAIRGVQEDLGMRFRQICDLKGWYSDSLTAFRVDQIPTVYLIDGKGRICWGEDAVGAAEAVGQEIDEAVREAIREMGASR